ncbi:hypothetical protein GE061_019669 [Apolygus lucorum]|uniref:Uncharacterized protein n=1 Tax=Apolygus lucorum TaxID=248454 RepID=A0A8S9XBQ5_APOLU|nr:hypothetical protein GE061_019669 [Apolygus lucorum]
MLTYLRGKRANIESTTEKYEQLLSSPAEEVPGAPEAPRAAGRREDAGARRFFFFLDDLVVWSFAGLDHVFPLFPTPSDFPHFDPRSAAVLHHHDGARFHAIR